jgi:hypothetical protein
VHSLKHSLFHFARRLLQHHQRLLPARHECRRDDATPHCQLVDPGLRHCFAAGRRDDACIRCTFGITGHAVPEQKMHVGKAKRPQVGARLVVQAAKPLHAVDLGSHHAQHRGLVAASGADFQHASQPSRCVPFSTQQQFDHARHDIGLRDGLAHADRQAGVLVGLVHQCTVDEAMALHLLHRQQDLRIRHTLSLQFLHHPGPHRL